MDSQLFAGPVIGIFCSGLNAYCMQTGPLFLRISGSSGVLKAFLLERNRQLSCNPKKKKKKKKKAVGPQPLVHGGVGLGKPAHQQVRQDSACHQAQKHGILSPGALIYRPRLLPLPGSNQTSAQVLQELESKWTAPVRLSSDLPDSQPAWMAPSRGHRQHWSQRQQR